MSSSTETAQQGSAAAATAAPSVAGRLRLVLLVVSLSSALGPFANALYVPSLVALRETFQTTNTWAGATFSVFAFVLASSQLVAGPLADRFSAKRLLVGGLVLYSVASVLAFFAPRIEVFIVARALQAMGAAAGLVVGGAIVTDRYPAAGRAKAMGTLQMFNAMGAALGPPVGSAIALFFVWQVDSLALVVAGVLVTAAAIRYLPQVAAPAQRLSLATIAAVIRFPVTGGVLLIAFVQYIGQFTFMAFMPVVMREHLALPEAAIGWLFLPHPLGVLIGSHVGGRLADRYGARPVLFVGGWASALFTGFYAATILLGSFPWTVAALTVFHVGYALSLGVSIPAQMALMVERFARNRGAAVGTYASLRYFGGAAGPVLTGLVLDRFGLASGFGTAALAMALGAAVGQILVGTRAAARVSQAASPE